MTRRVQGETALQALWCLVTALDLPSYRCACRHGPPSDAARCSACARHGGGARIFDLGSGIGNVVAGLALCASESAPMASIEGVELLPDLHETSIRVLAALRAQGAPTLPRVSVVCADLLAESSVDAWADADVVYMASTVFTDEACARRSSCLPHTAVNSRLAPQAPSTAPRPAGAR